MSLQRRVMLAAALLKRAAKELPPGSGERKERLFGALEEGAWDLPEELFAGDMPDDEWVEAALEAPEAQALLRRALANS